MSQKERKRLVVLAQVKEKKLSVAEAGRVMGISYRQAKRLWAGYRKSGDKGLVHKSRGRPGPRRKKASFRGKVLRRFRERYLDFGPTLAAEHLAKDGLALDHETLRRWLVDEGIWQAGRPRRQHRAWRERRPCFGAMVQMDGSEHDWFEGRRERAVLMVLIDDATNRTYAQFFEGETTRACYDALEGWIDLYGVPASLYVDRDSIYRCDRDPTLSEQIAGEEPRTQFGRAMDELGVELILAHSPQAKGRVERRNGLLQDRLVKELRLRGIKDLERANRFLREEFLPELNKRFTVQPRSSANAHRPKPRPLDAILSWQEERAVASDWTVRWKGKWLQIAREHQALNLAGKKVIVRERRDGTLEVLRGGEVLQSKILPQRPEKQMPPTMPTRGPIRPSKPAEDHPWKRDNVGNGKEFFRKEKARGAMIKREARMAAAAFAQPSLALRLPSSGGSHAGREPRRTGDIFA